MIRLGLWSGPLGIDGVPVVIAVSGDLLAVRMSYSMQGVGQGVDHER